MSFQNTRARVESVDEYFTQVRAPTTSMGLFLFSHNGQAAAPEELRKAGTEVMIYFDSSDMLLKVKAAPPRPTIPQRKAAAAPEEGARKAEQELVAQAPAPSAAAATTKPKIPARR